MFKELTDELLDLTVTTKGYRGALYAAAQLSCSCTCCCGSIGS
jgi:hypothetical protein